MKKFVLILLALSLCLASCEKPLAESENQQETITPAQDQPGDQPDDQPDDQPGDQPEDQPGDEPGNQPGGDQPGDKPQSVTCETLAASNIGFLTATLNGSIEATATISSSAQAGFVVSDQSVSSLQELINKGVELEASITDDGKMTCNVEGLDYGTTYTYMAYVTDGEATPAIGEISTFSTRDIQISMEFKEIGDLDSFSGKVSTECTMNGQTMVEDDRHMIILEPYVGITKSNATSLEDVVWESFLFTETIDGALAYFDLPTLTPEQSYTCGIGYILFSYDKIFHKKTKLKDFFRPIEYFVFQAKPLSDPSNAVDLGLSVRWHSCNLGANTPHGAGYYYSWAETRRKSDFSAKNYSMTLFDPVTYTLSLTRYCPYSAYGNMGYTDAYTTILAQDDAASEAFDNARWHIPTKAEWEELCDTRSNPDYKWERRSVDGMDEIVITYLKNGKSIILPAAGYYTAGFDDSSSTTLLDYGKQWHYWSSTLYMDNPLNAYAFDDLQAGHSYKYYRHYGQSVRPVYK